MTAPSKYIRTCRSCPAEADWIIPRPSMLPMVVALAERAGWTDERCPTCRHQFEHGRFFWAEIDVETVQNMREAGDSASQIAAYFSRLLGREVSRSAVKGVAHRQRQRMAA